MRIVRVGTRGSRLALAQTGQVIETLRATHPSISFESVVIKTTGDIRSDVPFAAVGTKGMFVKEIEEALLSSAIDLAIHSLKDMPGELPAGLALGAVPTREDPRDALVSHGVTLDKLHLGARIGSSSLRRQAQIRAFRPDLIVDDLRGNLDTRIRKLDDGNFDGIILACAGLERLGLTSRISERLSIDISVPAPGQGALALEVRAEDSETKNLLDSVNDKDASDAITAERAFQLTLDGGCHVPAGAFAEVRGDVLSIIAMIAAPDGSEVLRAERMGSRADAAKIGIDAATELLDRGGDRYLQQQSAANA